MAKSCIPIFKIRIRTYYWRTFCALVTLTVLVVWTISWHGCHGIYGHVKCPVQIGGVSEMKSLRSTLIKINKTHSDSSKKTNFTGVILLTYMRSGSSLTGEILQQNEHVFYVFEPLRILSHLMKRNQSVLWLNGTRSHVSTLNITSIKRQIINGWLTCDFSLVPAQALDDWYFLSFGKKTNVYNECIFKHFGVKYNYSYKNSSKTSSNIHIRLSAHRRGEYEQCLQDLKFTCLSSKFRIVKTIRTSMSLADDILSDVLESKLIHLIRDPRDTVISQARYQGCPGGQSSVLACSTWHCKTVEEDTSFKQRILTEKPGRVYTILYERISLYPIYVFELLYKFIGMNFSENISQYISMIVQGDNLTGCEVCEQSWQRRMNYTRQHDVRTYINDYLLSYIQSLCKNIIIHYKYEFYNVSRQEISRNKIISV